MWNLLASAIPGVRDLRAPLVAGYLWLLVAWLALDPSTPLAQHTDPGVARSLVDLAETVGPAATAAGVSVVAYVVGALSVSLPGVIGAFLQPPVLIGGLSLSLADKPLDTEASLYPRDAKRVPGRLRRWLFRRTASLLSRIPGARRTFDVSFVGMTGWWRSRVRELEALERRISDAETAQGQIEIRDTLWEYASSNLDALPTRPPALEEVRETLEDRWAELPLKDLRALLEHLDNLGLQIRRELDLPNTLLVGDQPEIYAEADRARAEAEFRLALVLPSVALVVVLMAREGWLWAFGFVASWALLVTGLAKQAEARTFIKNSIDSGKTPSPAVQRFVDYVGRRLGVDESKPEPQAPQRLQA
jgi:hypothetical protein